MPRPEGSDADPAAWLARVFDVRNAPVWVVALLGLRQVLAPLVGIPRGTMQAFAPSAVEGGSTGCP